MSIDLEKQIEEAAEKYSLNGDWTMFAEKEIVRKEAYISGAKSEAAKEYWQQGMYSEDEIWELLFDNTNIFLDWFQLAITNPEKANENRPDLLKWFESVKKKVW